MINEKLQNAIETGQVQLEADPNSSPLETSLKGYGLYFPVFKNMINHKLGGAAAKRILIALFANKLEPENTINLKDVREIETMKIANKLFQDILVIHLAAMLEAEQERQNKHLVEGTGKTSSELEMEKQLEVNGVSNGSTSTTSDENSNVIGEQPSPVQANS